MNKLKFILKVSRTYLRNLKIVYYPLQIIQALFTETFYNQFPHKNLCRCIVFKLRVSKDNESAQQMREKY